ncbi:hypothetical protein PTSG_07853 [Salpingoeca rosetta]|uniref:KH type-2 domain-containing protein n=1 Tax=Salpingoeca rosetta (strain ATCC 50818 / BSB-021) TaxID=946362 RepID=F2UGI9_SALR5|nr:uncharacterized protein PTSG_07853 [Salpingoeca rosetta]EGD75739.1 hypothetical protein PTSG_07853 [Salpingoeca rosetta]|eukprot:XP_004991660.1 hypothetical protein PTSG_07853 [Salpingoeca rosetta]
MLPCRHTLASCATAKSKAGWVSTLLGRAGSGAGRGAVRSSLRTCARSASSDKGGGIDGVGGTRERHNQPEQLSCHVAVVGSPNVGKSTLANAIVGAKVAAVSPRAHTTRREVHCIWTHDNTQVVLSDTPGLVSHQLARKLRTPRSLLIDPRNAIFDSDIVAAVVDDTTVLDERRWHALRSPQRFLNTIGTSLDRALTGKRAFLVINKVDCVPQQQQLDAFVAFVQQHARARSHTANHGADSDCHGSRGAGVSIDQKGAICSADAEEDGSGVVFERIFPVSALDPATLGDLKEYLQAQALPKPWQYDSGQVTSHSFPELLLEIVREQMFLRYKQEIPYVLQHNLDSYEVDEDGVLRIYWTISTEQRSQKPIVIGKKGASIREAATAIQDTLGSQLGMPVIMNIRVMSRGNKSR